MATAESWQKEEFSRAYVLAVATRAGFTIASWNVDKDGVDVTLRRQAIMIDLQLKCSQSVREVNDAYVLDLDIPTYDKLRAVDRSAPGYLALIKVPADVDLWVRHDPDRLLLHCAGFYERIQDRPPARGQTTTAIHLPRRQVLDASGLKEMLAFATKRIRAGTGEVAE